MAGTRFQTKKGEESVLVEEWHLLAKALHPLPDKFHGLQDEEARLRKRYLDLLLNSELRELFRRKAIFWNSMRAFLTRKGFLEVETPVFETTAGGADAMPFATHHNALDMDVYLRISMGELWQKRLMVAGFEKTFEIGRQFRNEGMSREHLQDYTQMEYYWAYADYTQGMELVEDMYKHVIKETYGTLVFTIGVFEEIDFGKPWKKISYVETIKEQTGVDVLAASQKDIRKMLDSLDIACEKNASKGRLVDGLWKYCRKSIRGPVFLVDHPVLVSPLAKRKKDNPELTERYQIIIAGSELGNGYSELNDPIDQAGRFEEQMKLREAGDTEAQMHDKDFVEALEYGMPPTTGFGVSERLFSFLENRPIRECVLFPLMKPEGADENKAKRSRGSKAAHIVVFKNPKEKSWVRSNTIAHLTAAFGARLGKRLFHLESYETKDGVQYPMNIQHAILIKETNNQQKLHALKNLCEDKKFHMECFTGAMIESSSDIKIRDTYKHTESNDVDILGVLLYGDRKEIERATKEFQLVK